MRLPRQPHIGKTSGRADHSTRRDSPPRGRAINHRAPLRTKTAQQGTRKQKVLSSSRTKRHSRRSAHQGGGTLAHGRKQERPPRRWHATERTQRAQEQSDATYCRQEKYPTRAVPAGGGPQGDDV